MRSWLKRLRPELVVLIALAALTRFWGLSQPQQRVFDEIYFQTFAAHYRDGHYFFDIHPPLGKLLLAGWSVLLHVPLGTMEGPSAAVAVRSLPALAGVLTVVVVWAILRRLNVSRPLAALGALAVVADNSLLVESRLILIDPLLLLFMLSSFWAYLVARTQVRWRRWGWLALAAAAAGMAASTKWTGLTALALLLALWAIEALRWRWRSLGELGLVIMLPVLIYVGCFWVHFQLLPKSGDGDAFMTPRFQSTLQGSPYYAPHNQVSFWSKFVELNHEMYSASATLTATHPYSSTWYQWPLELRPIYYWEGPVQADGKQGNIYLLGNPVVWWGVPAALVTGLLLLWCRGRRLRLTTQFGLLATGMAYGLNYLPFSFIKRVMFLYHYFPAFAFSLLGVLVVWNEVLATPHRAKYSARQYQGVAALAVVIVVGFVFFLPLSYGTPLSAGGFAAREWLASWR